MIANAATPGQRLRLSREAAGFKKRRSATDKFGWPYSTYANYENDMRSFAEHAPEFADAYGTTAEYLLTGKVNGELPNYSNILENSHAITRLPRLERHDLVTFEHIKMGGTPKNESGQTEPLPSQIVAGPRAYALAISDDALAGGRPSLTSGMLGFFDPDASYKTGDIVAAMIEGFPEIVMRKFRQIVGLNSQTAYELFASNPDHPGFSSETHRINLVGKMIGVFMPI